MCRKSASARYKESQQISWDTDFHGKDAIYNVEKKTIMTKTGLAGECDPQGKSEGGWTWVEEARSRRIYAAGEHPS